MRPMGTSDLPRASAQTSVNRQHTMECTVGRGQHNKGVQFPISFVPFPDFGFTAAILSQAIARLHPKDHPNPHCHGHCKFIPDLILVIFSTLAPTTVNLLVGWSVTLSDFHVDVSGPLQGNHRLSVPGLRTF